MPTWLGSLKRMLLRLKNKWVTEAIGYIEILNEHPNPRLTRRRLDILGMTIEELERTRSVLCSVP